ETAKYTEKSAILVATQVIEVGLDINCENLHTELAPANSILQRAGRCARYEGNTGHVYIYPPLKKDETEAVSLVEAESGDPSWANRLDTAPYMGAEGKLLLPTWKAFASHTAEGKPFSYHDELEIVNEVHTDLDARLLETLADKNRTMKSTMAEVMAGPDRGKARQKAGELIRNVDNITVVVHPNPNSATVPNPWDFEGFSLYRYSIQSKKFIAAALERLSTLGLDEGLWTPVELKDEAENSRRAVQYEWKKVVVDKHLQGHTLLFVHPDLATYDEELGFRFVLEGDEKSNGFQSESLSRGKGRPSAFSYNIESYKKHVGSVWKAYEKNRRDEVAWVSRRLEERLGVPQGMVDRSIRLTLACHDLGKLTEDWQDWAHDWQKRVGKLVKPEIMLAHTYYDPAISLHVELDKKLHATRPHHAVEGALAAHKLVYAAVGNNLVLARPIVSAVARHHSADSMAIVKHLRLSRYAAQTLQEVIDILAKGSEWRADSSLLLENLVGGNLIEKSGLVPQGETLEQLLYFLLVRVLRLSDREAIAHS
ncbi:MAG: HD domain-containing protein, partial [Chloroflexota bacterium]